MTDEPDDEGTEDDWYGDADPRVPDATPWPDRDLGFLGSDYSAKFVQSDSSGPVRSDFEREAELRELERRVEQQRTPAFPIDLRTRLPLEGLWRRWRALAMWGRSDVVDDFGRDPRATARWEWLFEFLYTRWFRVQAVGVENIPAHGRALLVANHAGTLPYDSAMVMHAVRRDHPSRRDVRPLVEDTVFHLPFLGPIMNRIGGPNAKLDPQATNRWPPDTAHESQPRSTSHKPQAAARGTPRTGPNHDPQATSRRPPKTAHGSQPRSTSHKPQAAEDRARVPTTIHKPQATSHKPPKTAQGRQQGKPVDRVAQSGTPPNRDRTRLAVLSPRGWNRRPFLKRR